MQILEITFIGILIGVSAFLLLVMLFLFSKRQQLAGKHKRILQDIESGAYEVSFE